MKRSACEAETRAMRNLDNPESGIHSGAITGANQWNLTSLTTYLPWGEGEGAKSAFKEQATTAMTRKCFGLTSSERL